MKSEVEVLNGLARKVNVEVPMDRVEAAFAQAYQKIRKTAAIKGFRKGKAPIGLIAKMYREQVTPDVVQSLIQEGYATALDSHNLDPVSYPDIKYDQFDPAQGFTFSAEFEVRPEVGLSKVDGLIVLKERLEVSEQKVDEVIDNIRQNRAELVPVIEDRGAITGDTVTIDFSGSLAGGPLEGGSANGHQVEIGSEQLIPGFEDGLVGLKPGSQKSLHLTFPADYHASELAGQPVEFKVSLIKIERKRVPELNDEFVASLGGQVKTVDDLRVQIRKDLTRSEEKRIDGDLKNRLLKVLVRENPVEVPQGLFLEQKKALIDDVHRRMREQGLNQQQFEEYKANWDADFNETARQMVQSSFLIDGLAKAHDLFCTSHDLDQKLKEYADETGLDLAKLKEFYSDSKKQNRLAYQITEEKVINYLLSKAKITEVTKEQLAE